MIFTIKRQGKENVMNIHNMNCFLDDMEYGLFRNLVVEYNCGEFIRALLHGDSGLITFYHRKGMQHQVDVSANMKVDYVFISQYGIGITDDGKYFFVPSWKHGLYCFEMETGRLVWKSARRHPQSYVVRNDTVVCFFEMQGLEILSINDGAVLRYYPYSGASICFALTDELLLVGMKRNKYHLFNEYLNVIQTIPSRVLNPKEYDHFMLVDAYLEHDYIQLSGFEGWRDELFRSTCEGKSNDFIENQRFIRRLPIHKTEDGGYILGESDEI